MEQNSIMVSTGDETAPVEEAAAAAPAASRQERSALGHNPATVSSLSSIDTAGYEYNDLINATEQTTTSQQSTNPHPLPPIPSSSANDSSSAFLPQSYSYTTADATATATESTEAQQQLQAPTSVPPSSISLMGRTTMQLSPSTGVVVPAAPTANTVPEFLYQLTKMLTDNNRDIIEWSNGKIEVHNPHKLETHVLNRYFRHSKFASFQRQLNYFGFRKIAGKGKMAPCSYVNDSTTHELGSLLLVKRKQGNEPKAKNGKNGKKSDRDQAKTHTETPHSADATSHYGSQAGAGAAYSTSNNGASNITVDQSQKALARVAVGKGVRHGYVPRQTGQQSRAAPAVASGKSASVVAPSPVQASLNALTNNYRNSLNELQSAGTSGNASDTATGTGSAGQAAATAFSYVPGSLSRDDSLVDLAMIPFAEEGTGTSDAAASSGFSFVDFPFDANFLANDDFNESPQE